MPAYLISPEALEDLQSIWDFIAADNPTAADRQVDQLLEAFEQLAQWPGKGHSRSDLTDRPLRFWPVGSYLVVYREAATPLQIVAILHGARDVPSVIKSR